MWFCWRLQDTGRAERLSFFGPCCTFLFCVGFASLSYLGYYWLWMVMLCSLCFSWLGRRFKLFGVNEIVRISRTVTAHVGYIYRYIDIHRSATTLKPLKDEMNMNIDHLKAISAPWTICPVPLDILKQFLLCGMVHCPAGEATAIKECCCHEGCTWSAAVFGWVTCVKWRPHECQNPRFPSGASHCSGMIGVFHFTYQWF